MQTPFYVQDGRVVLPELPNRTPVRTTRAIQSAVMLSGEQRGTVDFENNSRDVTVTGSKKK